VIDLEDDLLLQLLLDGRAQCVRDRASLGVALLRSVGLLPREGLRAGRQRNDQ
jgi:hypothetical protein